jgi:hypothetical protein
MIDYVAHFLYGFSSFSATCTIVNVNPFPSVETAYIIGIYVQSYYKYDQHMQLRQHVLLLAIMSLNLLINLSCLLFLHVHEDDRRICEQCEERLVALELAQKEAAAKGAQRMMKSTVTPTAEEQTVHKTKKRPNSTASTSTCTSKPCPVPPKKAKVRKTVCKVVTN